jgi:uncharacterized protein with NAD-binding domain and iron-sulfur cluster
MSDARIKIAILGGGIAGLTTAFELTEHDPKGKLYDISVYTLGWRLGGKAAVGRGANNRILEHGLHVWAGFYDNAFDLVQRVYAALGYPQEAWRRAFEGVNHVTVMESIDGNWKPWLLEAMPNRLDPGLGPEPPSPLAAVRQLLLQLAHFAANFIPIDPNPQHHAARVRELSMIVSGREVTASDTALSLAGEAARRLPDNPRLLGEADRRTLLGLLTSAQGHVAAMSVLPSAENDDRRRASILISLALALLRGILEDVIFDGYAAIDNQEWSEWLAKHGCTRDLLDSAPVRACYDYVFGYLRGERKVGAGTGTHLLLRFLLTYKGSFFYTLRAPMGDFLIAPIYHLLRRRGVRFEFFHRLDELRLSEDGSEIAEIVLTRQVDLRRPEKQYFPLVKIRGVAPELEGWSWPATPRYAQIKDGDELKRYDLESAWTDWTNRGRRILKRLSPDRGAKAPPEADTFDFAVLAVGLGALLPICSELTKRYPETWGNFLTKVSTVQTVAAQLWLKPTTEELGWPDARTVLTAFEKLGDSPDYIFHSWEDNSGLLARERWDESSWPATLAYFAGVFPEMAEPPPPGPCPDFPEAQHRRAYDALRRFMENRLPVLWPAARDPSTSDFRWELLAAPDELTGPARLSAQYVRANINPSDRYVLSVPGSLGYRLQPDQSGLRNLLLAGDWVRTGLSAGCIEAAVMAGRAAAQSITGARMTIPGNDPDGTLLPMSLLPLIGVGHKLKRTIAGGIGSMDAHCAVIDADPAHLKHMLPPGLILVPPRSWKKHKLIFLFGRQRNVRPGFVPLGGMNYHEFVELIPYVMREDGKNPAGGPFSYMPHLLLDQLAPVLIGVSLYGYKKRLAHISSEAGAFDIRSDLGTARALFSTVGMPGSSSDFKNLHNLCAILRQPLVSRAPTGAWIYSRLEFAFDLAVFQPVVGEAVIDPGIVWSDDGKPKGYKFHSISNDPFGAFRMSADWSLSLPLSAGNLSDHPVPPDLRRFASIWTQTALGQLNRLY